MNIVLDTNWLLMSLSHVVSTILSGEILSTGSTHFASPLRYSLNMK